MRVSNRFLYAAPAPPPPSSTFQQLPLALLPPLPLYRRLLRAHRKFLTADMRVLGDQYIKSEFRLHKNAENPMHIIAFLTEWQMYAQQVEGEAWKGQKLDKAKIDKMNDQQLGQLYELMQAIQKNEGGSNDEGT